MIRWICGVSLKVRKTNEEWSKLVGVQPTTTVIRSGRLRWYGHVIRKNDEDLVKEWLEIRVESRRPVGRPKVTLLESVRVDMTVQPYRKTDYKPIIIIIVGHLEMVLFLLEAGADQEHKTDEMHTALMEASMDGHVEVARLLLDSGAQVN